MSSCTPGILFLPLPQWAQKKGHCVPQLVVHQSPLPQVPVTECLDCLRLSTCCGVSTSPPTGTAAGAGAGAGPGTGC